MALEFLALVSMVVYLGTTNNTITYWDFALYVFITLFILIVDVILGYITVFILKSEQVEGAVSLKTSSNDLFSPVSHNPEDLFSPVVTKPDETLDDEVDLEFISSIRGDELFNGAFDEDEGEVDLTKLEFTPRTRGDFLEHKTSLQSSLNETYNTFRNEFLAYVFNDSIDLPEEYPKDSKDKVTTLLGGSYLSDVLYYLPEGSKLYFQNRLKKEYQEYEITFSSEGYGVYYRLK
jgi:hypothetical protein